MSHADDAEAKKSEEHNTLFQGNKLLSFYDIQEEIGRCSGRDILDHLLSKDFVTETQPANIAMAQPVSEEIKICDFGLAKEIDTSLSQYSQFGTPEFVAPEIAFQSPVSKATDIWSIGVLTYLWFSKLLHVHPLLPPYQADNMFWEGVDHEVGHHRLNYSFSHDLLRTQPLGWFCPEFADLSSGGPFGDSFMGFKSIPLMRSIAEILNESSTSTFLTFSQYNMEDKKSLPSASSSYQEESSISKQTANILSSTMDPVSSANIWVKEVETPVLNNIWHESALATKDSPSDLNVSSSVKNTYQLENTQKEEEMLLEQCETIAQKQFGVTVGDARDESDPVVHKKAPCSDIQSDLSAVTMNSLHMSKDENKEAVHFTKIPRHSVIKSTFYSKSTESSPVSTRHCLQQNKARRQLMKAGYSSGILSGLREPLLKHFNINEERTMHLSHGYRSNSLNMLAAISKSSTVDNEQRLFQSRLINSQRSQSLDFFEKKTYLLPISETRTEEYIDTCSDKPEEDFESKERIVSDICDKHDYHSCATVGNDETYTTSNAGNEDFLPEEIKVFTRSKSVPVGLETKLMDHNGIHENTMVALSHDAIGELSHDMLLRHVFAEPQTSKLSAKDVSDLIISQYDTPNSIHFSLKTIETLDNENTGFGLQRTLSESAIKKSHDLSSFHICEDPTRKVNLSFKPEDDSHNSVTHYPAQPDMFMQYPSDILPRPSATHAEIETGASAAYTEEITQRPSSPHLLMQFPENNNELEPELLNLLEGTEMSTNVFDSDDRMTKIKSAGKNIMSEKSYSLTEGSSEWLHEAQHDVTPRSCSSQETKLHSAKLSKHGLFRLFKKSMSVDQPSAPQEKDSPGWSQGQRKTGSTSLFKPNQQSKLGDLSITKKVRASVYNISRAVLGKQVFDKREDLPTSLSCPEVIQVDEDGVMLMWKPIESSESITYNIQYRVEDYHIPLIRAISTGPESSSTLQYQHPHLQMHKTYTFMSEINRGRFSIIRQCREDLTDIIFAAKITPYKAERRQAILQEYHILKKLQHSNVVKLQAAFITPKYLVLIEELCAGRELLHTLAERDSYTEMEVREFLLQILHGTEYLHSNHIIHLDLKSENIIVSENNVLKIVDFGCAQEFTPGSSWLVDKIKEICEIKAPEILEGNAVEPVTDVWSVGFLAFEMLSADCPFASDIDCEKEKNIKKGKVKFGRCYPGLTEGAVTFLKNTLNHKPW
ncbi:OBSCN protein, partial [Polypterus senegalus]|nr:OBSCN protein [Polypterus senegalus]